ncbi:MAG: M24 family metallopeptidase [Synergistaceae bacterium]|jgi:Xaa-Pro aminopeptidase|nr:M24 family metallopeptidase [Synergistaceae bacterium]
MDINEHAAALRAEMKKAGIDMYMVTTEDAYLAESATDYWRTLRWLTAFSGTLAYAIFTQDRAAFFTDARYIEWSSKQVKIDGVELYDVTVLGADYYLEWITTVLGSLGQSSPVFGVDGRTITTARKELIDEALKRVPGASMKNGEDLMAGAWKDRPAPDFKPIFDYPVKYAGRNRSEKAGDVRAEMARRGCDHYIVCTMEGVVWLTNMRGRDIINPLFMSHVLFTPDCVKLFAEISMIPEALQRDLVSSGYELHDIDDASAEIAMIPAGAAVYYDVYRTNSRLSSAIPPHAEVVRGFDIINDLKSIKNSVEIENFKRTNVTECVALTRFFKFLKERGAPEGYTEYQLDGIMEEFHRRSPEFICSGSYPAMCAYMANGAMPHYNPTPDIAVELKPEGVIITDVCGHYFGGTTDITRTTKLGPCPRYDDDIRKDYTLVLKSISALTRQLFRKGTDGAYLDSAARCVLWNSRIHYGYGTGHGIGSCIVAHEGPQFISETSYKKEWAFCSLPIKPGMVMAIEPGVYKSGRYGIRLEDNLVVVEDTENEFGQWYKFETMSYLPFEPDLIDTEMMSGEELAWLNGYHAKTYSILSPHLDEDERSWLRKMTAPLSKAE